MINSEFSDYIVYVDESGDHALNQVESPYPIFCLSFCVFEKLKYIEEIVPKFQALKFKFFGDDTIVLHERDVRRSIGDFGMLRQDKELRLSFLSELTDLVSMTPMEVISAVIDKKKLNKSYSNPYNPYEIALLLCMERLLLLLKKNKQKNKIISVIFECRGKNEDQDLEVVFRRICANENQWGYKRHDFSQIEFRCRFVAKSANSTGLQLADLTARPIGMSVLRPEQLNRAFESFKEKVDLKCFP
ncbi:MAG: DUF3800 domain-containing protein [Litorimonas sp.]